MVLHDWSMMAGKSKPMSPQCPTGSARRTRLNVSGVGRNGRNATRNGDSVGAECSGTAAECDGCTRGLSSGTSAVGGKIPGRCREEQETAVRRQHWQRNTDKIPEKPMFERPDTTGFKQDASGIYRIHAAKILNNVGW